MTNIWKYTLTIILVLSFGSSVAMAAVPGDVTGDDEVDVSDIQCTVLTNLNPVAPACLSGPDSADLNCDSTVDIVDVQLIVLIVLAYPQNGVPAAQDANGDNIVDECDPPEQEVCPDGECTSSEDSCNCPQDCPGACCGNGICEAPDETEANCAEDCEASGQYNPGDVVITEIMKNPKVAGDENGEWFEVRVLVQTVNLKNWTIKDNGGDLHVITGNGLSFQPGAMIIMGNNADTSVNGSIDVDYEYAGFNLDDSNDGIMLVAPDGTVIDQVFYNVNSFPNIPGRALSLNTNSMTASANDNGANWCPATMVYGDGDYGTPGFVNNNCPAQDPICGNGITEPPLEQCDDNNAQDGDGCDSQCQLEDKCGNGSIDAGEQCDDGNKLNGDGCNSWCQTEIDCGNGFCDPLENADICPEDCGGDCSSICGNWVTECSGMEDGEECDDGPMGSQCCSTQCKSKPCGTWCGDGIVQPEDGEQCEPPNTDECDQWCHEIFNPGAECGNGVIEDGEDCEPPGQGNCNDWCKFGWVCCTPSPCCCDGNLDPGEECDDGNDIDGDDCSSECTIGSGSAGIAGTVSCDANPSGADKLWVFAHPTPITDPIDPFGGEGETGADWVSFENVSSFPKNYEVPVGEAGNFYVWAVWDIGGDGEEGFTEGVDIGGLYPDPVQVEDGKLTQPINIELDCSGANATGCISGTISHSGNVTANDTFEYGASSTSPLAGTTWVVKASEAGPSFPFSYTLCSVPVGTYYFVGSLDVGSNSSGEPGAEDFFGVYQSVSNMSQVTVIEEQTVSGVNFTLEQP